MISQYQKHLCQISDIFNSFNQGRIYLRIIDIDMYAWLLKKIFFALKDTRFEDDENMKYIDS